jgi:hypothetical protein
MVDGFRLLAGLDEPARKRNGERVQCWLRPAVRALPALSGGVDRHDCMVDALDRGLLVREATSGLDRFPDPGVDRLDRLRSVDLGADLVVQREERHGLGPTKLGPHNRTMSASMGHRFCVCCRPASGRSSCNAPSAISARR